LMGQIAQNRCYTLARLISRMFKLEYKNFFFSFLREGNLKTEIWQE